MAPATRKVGIPFAIVVGILVVMLVQGQLSQNNLQDKLAFKEVSAQSAYLLIELENLRQIGNEQLGSLDYLPTLKKRVEEIKKRVSTIQTSTGDLKSFGKTRMEVDPATHKKLKTLETVLEEILKDQARQRQSLDLPVETSGEGRVLGELRLGVIQLIGTGPDRKNLISEDLMAPSTGKALLRELKTGNVFLEKKNSLEAAGAYSRFLLLSQKELARKTEIYSKMMREQNIFRASRILQSQGYFDQQIKVLMLPAVQALFDLSRPEPAPAP